MQECSPFGQTKSERVEGHIQKTHRSGDGLLDAPVFIFLLRFHQINQQKRTVVLRSLTGDD